MPVSLDDKFVIAITSMALFDFREADNVFIDKGENEFRQYQKANIDTPANPGTAFKLIQKLLKLNNNGTQHIEVFVLSKNDPFSGLRVFKSADHHKLSITRGIFTRGRSPGRYLRAIKPILFLSESYADVRMALDENVPAAIVGLHAPEITDKHPDELRIALDGDGVLFSDESEKIFQKYGLEVYQKMEAMLAKSPMNSGPLFAFVNALRKVQDATSLKLRLALVTARNSPAHERALRTLDALGISVDEAFFLGGLEKTPFLKEFEPDIFFDDQMSHIKPAEGVAAVAHVPCGIGNRQNTAGIPLDTEDINTASIPKHEEMPEG